jgi:WD40 repeat protein
MTLAFSSDGKMLATAGGDKTGGDKSIRLWDMATQKQIGATLVGHHGSVMSVMFSSDSTTLASGSVDGTVRLWDTTTGRSVGAPFQADASGIAIAAYSQDGKTIIAGDYGTKVWRWNIDLASSQERACHIANRNLTQAEWAQYINPDPSTYRPTCQELPLEPEPTPAPTRMP